VTCRLCDGSCDQASLDALLDADLIWLWEAVAAAGDRRGDPDLIVGRFGVTTPVGEAGRAAAIAVVGRHLPAAKRVTVDLSTIAAAVAPATPGAVAAHAVGRRLALRAAAKAARTEDEMGFRSRLVEVGVELSDDQWSTLRRSGWVGRALTAGAAGLAPRIGELIRRLPVAGAAPVDRRQLAHDATGDPHALDGGQILAGLTLAVLTALRRCAPSGRARGRWEQVGVLYDDIVGGLTCVGIAPAGWTIPEGVPVTLPPRALADCLWPRGDCRVFVTENPSVLSAATGLPAARMICTSGTPSAVELRALGRLAAAGWQLHVRADFDDKGIQHVNAMLAHAENALPWRMSSSDYLAGLRVSEAEVSLRLDRLAEPSWDAELAAVMRTHGTAVFEESLMASLLDDVAAQALKARR
jgi:uncharacterized protein (TIGR02679 family)